MAIFFGTRFHHRVRIINAMMESFFKRSNFKPSQTPIDIIVPIIAKDLDIFPLSLQSIRENIANKIENIYIVAPIDERIIEFCKENNLTFIDENSVLGYGVKDINYVPNGVNRAGWLFQQLLKLSGNIGDCENYVCIDSDHILMTPHVFLTDNNKFVFYRSTEYNAPYYDMIENLIGDTAIPSMSYVAHKVIFNKTLLNELKEKIKEHTGLPWDVAIQTLINKNGSEAGFSEWELYGCFVPKSMKHTLPWNQLMLERKDLDSLENLGKKYSTFRSVTFPAYIENGGLISRNSLFLHWI